eukprot:403359557
MTKDIKDIKIAYYKLAKLYHPDMIINKNENQMKNIHNVNQNQIKFHNSGQALSVEMQNVLKLHDQTLNHENFQELQNAYEYIMKNAHQLNQLNALNTNKSHPHYNNNNYYYSIKIEDELRDFERDRDDWFNSELNGKPRQYQPSDNESDNDSFTRKRIWQDYDSFQQYNFNENQRNYQCNQQFRENQKEKLLTVNNGLKAIQVLVYAYVITWLAEAYMEGINDLQNSKRKDL